MAQPEKKFRIGSVTASVFSNTTGQHTWRSVVVQRQYKDGEIVKYQTNFTLAELPAARRVLELATVYVESKEVVTSSDK